MSDERLLATFLDLVGIASPSFREGAIAEYVERRLAKAGAVTRFDASALSTGSDTGNLVAEVQGTGPGFTVVLSAHLDTVEPCEGVVSIVEDGIIRSSGDTILGADDKAGVAAIIETVERLAESDDPHPSFRVVLTVAEEKGLIGAKALDPADLEGDGCLVLDADGTPGGVVVGSPTHYTFSATFHGRAAHAGVEPEKGFSALVMVARAVDRMALGRLDEETTANVGTIEGGAATNVVAPMAVVTGECRSRSTDRVEEVRSAMDSAMRQAADDLGGRVEIFWTKEYEAVHFDEDDPLLALVESSMVDAGVEPYRFMTGGGSDGNVICAKGIPALVLSIGMQEVHGVEEHISVADLQSLARVLESVIRRAGD